MNKKIGIILSIASVLVIVGAGCGSQSPSILSTDVNTGSDIVVADTEDKTDIYASAQEISSTNSVANEVKSILKDACEAVKLTEVLKDPMSRSDIFIYVWKNEPTAETLENAFSKGGYSIDMSGEALLVSKGNTSLAVSWAEEIASQEIGVMIYE